MIIFLFHLKVLIPFQKNKYINQQCLSQLHNYFSNKWSEDKKKYTNYINIGITLSVVVYFLTHKWMPLGAGNSLFVNFLLVIIVIAVVLGSLMTVVRYYPRILQWCLANKWKFLSIPIFIVFFGIFTWQGAENIFGFVPEKFKSTKVWQSFSETFPGIGKEFMPSLDEGSFLLMPTTMPHSGIEENIDVIRKVDINVNCPLVA